MKFPNAALVADGLQLALSVAVDIKLGCENLHQEVQANARLA
jgi:hypothetical protein